MRRRAVFALAMNHGGAVTARDAAAATATADEAKAYVAKLKSDKRYQRDVY